MNWLIDDPTTAVLASLFLAMILAAAAIPKLRQPEEFQGVVANYRLLPSFMVVPFARLLPWIELVCAAALLVPPAREIAAWVAAALFVMFGLALAINVGRGRTHIDCGCVRRPTSMSRIGMFHVLRAIALAGVSLYAAAVPVEVANISWGSALMGVAAATMLALLYLAADLMVGLPDRASKKLDFE
ncbi:Methylamine utilisation protein MauE [Methylobacillus rhizosphaerae]|uniref:Methylamine utilization protein MauE n=1 Tax=Methylobacillus rhizosphaerae TaxID=551994 RepID=A0A238Z7W1_9PROT|nr:MauE/DoxX family redox-associated membrane protein [Methylobacillus rhizosphaerae]SNR79556.1 Methylamine utilisation protein MauE [Methylobacillus rhizosphaerae]